MTHLPPFWRVRLCRVLRIPIRRETLKLFAAWAKAEGGSARWNPWNTTLRVPGSWDYNTAGVQNYRRPIDGLSATAMTLANGNYNGILGMLQGGKKTALEVVNANAAEFDKWGTGAAHIRALL